MSIISAEKHKLPVQVFDNIFAFPPNRDTLGGTAYLILENNGNILIDSPAWNEHNFNFITEHGGLRSLFITHRTAIGRSKEFQLATGCEILIQEQEAYLLPQTEIKTFSTEYHINDQSLILWTCGHSPGSSCLYYNRFGGILFSGRNLLPNQSGDPTPLHTVKTFHWPRQIRSVKMLLERFSPDTLNYILPGANTGFLRGKKYIDLAYQKLLNLDLNSVFEHKHPSL